MLTTQLLAEAIEVFELRRKHSKIPKHMQIPVPKAGDDRYSDWHPLHKDKLRKSDEETYTFRSTEDPYDRDLWRDLLE